MIALSRGLCTDHRVSAEREWLVTNGAGAYASGTVAGILTRRYHGLLVAALKPPVGRTLLCSRLDEIVTSNGREYSLYANSWSPRTVFTSGFIHLDRFELEGSVPLWHYVVGDAILQKRVWMAQGANTTYVEYRLQRAHAPLQLRIKGLVNYRGYHEVTRGGEWQMGVEEVPHGVCVRAHGAAVPFWLLAAGATVTPMHIWHRNYHLGQEAYRGESDVEDHLCPVEFAATLHAGEVLTVVISAETDPDPDGSASLAALRAREAALIASAPICRAVAGSPEADAVRQLVLAADQFLVQRSQPDFPDGRTLIAGYHWFTDWGRDTMISLPGLTLATGRAEIARQILLTYAGYLSEGMLPNRFPDEGEEPEYNTVDATLWFVEAVRAYHAATGDDGLLRALWSALQEIIHRHVSGTRYQIRMDSSDGLLYAGEPGVQLTWMDAKVGDWVVTPRIGKPVEINALWYNALRCMALFAQTLEEDPAPWDALAERTQAGFRAFWNNERGYCYDVIGGPGGTDPVLRPNQIFAVSLPFSALTEAQQKAVVQVVLQELWTPVGVRSLGPNERGYIGRYGGDRHSRDGAYHQGTVWSWLIAPLALAHLRLYGDRAAARELVRPMFYQLADYGMGTIGEIFDGDAPFTPRGCIAQAWGVAALLQAWEATLPATEAAV
jgi:predicted glycogen debranching enzyme